MEGPAVVQRRFIALQAIYVMWLREMIRTARAPSRVIGSLVMPLVFLAFLGAGLRGPAMGLDGGVDYLTFLAPGMMGMSLLMGSVFSGLHVLWDRQFGFLREIMVTPVSRLSILLGRVAGGMTMALIQGAMVGVGAAVMGVRFQLDPLSLLQAVAAMVLVSTSFVAVGTVFASLLDDFQGFSLIVNFFVFPTFFLSGAVYPVANLPPWIRPLSAIDPLTYGVDLMRGALVGVAVYPVWWSFGLLATFCLAMLTLGSVLFARLEVT